MLAKRATKHPTQRVDEAPPHRLTPPKTERRLKRSNGENSLRASKTHAGKDSGQHPERKVSYGGNGTELDDQFGDISLRTREWPHTPSSAVRLITF
jgi:hypothetical protein